MPSPSELSAIQKQLKDAVLLHLGYLAQLEPALSFTDSFFGERNGQLKELLVTFLKWQNNQSQVTDRSTLTVTITAKELGLTPEMQRLHKEWAELSLTKESQK
jgi:hypothetical protein